MKRILAILILMLSVLPLLCAEENSATESAFRINAYKLRDKENKVDLNVSFTNIYSFFGDDGLPINYNDEIEISSYSINKKPTDTGGMYLDLFQISVITDTLVDVSISWTGPNTFVFSDYNQKDVAVIAKAAGLKSTPTFGTNHKVDWQYFYYGTDSISGFSDGYKNGTGLYKGTITEIFGSSGDHIDGFVEYRLTMAVAIEGGYDNFVKMSNAGALYELPYIVTVTVSGV